MAEHAAPIFNKAAMEKLRSPDDLDKVVRVTRPSVWVVLAALAAFLAGILAWGLFGTVSVNVSGNGVVTDGQAVCFLSTDDAARVQEGNGVLLGGAHLKVAGVSAIPLSRDEVAAILKSDYLVDTLVKEKWAYEVVLDGDISGLVEGVPLSMNIVTERVAPISLVLGN